MKKENRPSDAEAAPKEFRGSATDNTPGGTDDSTQTAADFNLESGSRTQLVRVVTRGFLTQFVAGDPAMAEQGLLYMLNAEIAAANVARKKTSMPELATFATLPREAVADLIAYLFIVRKVRPPKSADRGMLAIYQTDGPDEGIYVGRPEYLRSVVRLFLPGATPREANDVLSLLREAPEELVPTVTTCDARDLVPVANGIFDYATKELLDFSPDYVFTAKVRTRYVPDAPNPIIVESDGSWDVASWVLEMFGGNEDLASAWWHVVGASVRTNVSWDQGVYFFDEDGGSGKGTTLELMRGLHGDDSCSSLAIADFAADRRFRLAELEGKTLNACDENAVGDFNDDLASYKAVITGDVINFERKMEQPYSARANVFMVQCLNGHQKSKDTSQSARRRQYFLPFPVSFTGQANKAIKYDYVRRPEVLEYVLCKVLHDMPDFYVLPLTEEGEHLADEARFVNDPVFQFWTEFADQFVWDLLPSDFLYDLYRSWFNRVNPNGRALSKIEFTRRLTKLVRELDDWAYTEGAVRVGNRMDKPEHLIAEYDLKAWMNPAYKGSDPDKPCRPALKDRYRGFERVQPTVAAIQQPPSLPSDAHPFD